MADILQKLFPVKDAQQDKNKIPHHVFSGSTTMIGVCITIIALFKTMKAAKDTYADELLSVATFFFIASSLLSYLSLRKNDERKLEWLADIIFFTGMVIMLGVGFVIAFTDI